MKGSRGTIDLASILNTKAAIQCLFSLFSYFYAMFEYAVYRGRICRVNSITCVRCMCCVW